MINFNVKRALGENFFRFVLYHIFIFLKRDLKYFWVRLKDAYKYILKRRRMKLEKKMAEATSKINQERLQIKKKLIAENLD